MYTLNMTITIRPDGSVVYYNNGLSTDYDEGEPFEYEVSYTLEDVLEYFMEKNEIKDKAEREIMLKVLDRVFIDYNYIEALEKDEFFIEFMTDRYYDEAYEAYLDWKRGD